MLTGFKILKNVGRQDFGKRRAALIFLGAFAWALARLVPGSGPIRAWPGLWPGPGSGPASARAWLDPGPSFRPRPARAGPARAWARLGPKVEESGCPKCLPKFPKVLAKISKALAKMFAKIFKGVRQNFPKR